MDTPRHIPTEKKPVVVAVSGGFDPLHAGHVRLFQEARALGDRLVVLLNNDNWLRAKKTHLFMDERERKEILEALSSVDEVVITKHPENVTDMSVCKELLELRPAIFANGGDRHKNNTPETGACAAIGCAMVFNIGKGGKFQSSSWLLEKHVRKITLQKHASASAAKKVIMFDLDGTLAKSKAPLDAEMSSLLRALLNEKIVAVTSGGKYPQFQKQLLRHMKCDRERLKNFFILPVSGGSLYSYGATGWRLHYKHTFNTREKIKILNAFKHALKDIRYIPPQKTYGSVLEDRESQITFSALGQKASVEKKREWNEKNDSRRTIISALKKRLPEFEVRSGGLTSIDVTQKGIDKAYGIQQLMHLLSLSKKDIAYVGDALYPGGNDHVVKRTGVRTIHVKDEDETKDFIRLLLSLQ